VGEEGEEDFRAVKLVVAGKGKGKEIGGAVSRGGEGSEV
jgi:hypothetical protein